jgi:two-component sensor histidine kinase
MNESSAITRDPAEPSELPTADNPLISAAHHRVGNSLALIASIVRMQARKMVNGGTHDIPAADVRRMLEEVGQRLEAVGRLHGRLARQNGPVELADYLREIATSASAALSFAGPTRLRFDMAQSCVVSAQAAPLVGLAVSELVMNALKFAHPAGVAGDLLIACKPRDDLVVVEVIDDGVGLPEGFDPAVDGQFGLQLLRSLAVQLKARLEFVNTGIGLRVRLSLPLVKP